MKADKTMHFTKENLTSLKPNPKRREFYYDAKIPNLAFAVNPKGTKAFFLYQWVNRKPERIRIGRFPDMTLDAAKTELKILQGLIAKGDNPAKSRRESRNEPTLREFFEESYMKRHAKIKKKSWKSDISNFDRYLGKLADRQLSDIDDARVFRLHSSIGKNNGQYAANRTIMLLSVIYNKALKWKVFSGDNPTSTVELFHEPEREVYLDKDEIGLLTDSVHQEEDQAFIDFYHICLLTGVRSGNIHSMSWDQIDPDFERWTIPRTHTKNKQPHVVQLTRRAMEILIARKEQSDGSSEFVFHEGDSKKCGRQFRNMFAKAVKRAGIQHCRVHDLRHTVASWLVSSGKSLAITQKVMGHLKFQSTLRYAHVAPSPVRESLEDLADGIFEDKEEEDGGLRIVHG